MKKIRLNKIDLHQKEIEPIAVVIAFKTHDISMSCKLLSHNKFNSEIAILPTGHMYRFMKPNKIK